MITEIVPWGKEDYDRAVQHLNTPTQHPTAAELLAALQARQRRMEQAERGRMNLQQIERGDVIQIAPDKFSNMFGGLLAFVSSVKPWGVIAYVLDFEGQSFVRLKWMQFERVGPAPFIPGSLIEVDD